MHLAALPLLPPFVVESAYMHACLKREREKAEKAEKAEMTTDGKSSRYDRKFYCGLMSGMIQAGVFNFWDRGLYLSVKHSRPFLRADNFRNPFTGLNQTIFQRSLTAGVYFPLEDIMINNFPMLKKDENNDSKAAMIFKTWMSGNITGAMNGMIVNPISAVKYNFWGKVECGSETFLSTSIDMFKQGGFRPFLVGMQATILRDVIFGGCFTMIRYNISNNSDGKNRSKSSIEQTCINIYAGFIATMLSSPLNYVRNVHYATPPSEKPLPVSVIMHSLIKDTESIQSLRGKLENIGIKLRLGWGTLRVGCGMTLGSFIYEQCCKNQISGS